MHPRQTRSRPLVLLKYPGYKLFLNNINSPGLFRFSSLLPNNVPPLSTDAVTCCCQKPIRFERINGMVLKPFFVEFWHELKAPFGPVAAVEVHAPSCWSSKFLLELFLKDLGKHGIISLVNTYLLSLLGYATTGSVISLFLSSKKALSASFGRGPPL